MLLIKLSIAASELDNMLSSSCQVSGGLGLCSRELS